MSEAESASDVVLLVDYRKRRQRNSRRRVEDEHNDQMIFSDSEMSRKQNFDNVYSAEVDAALSDDSLPSLRAKLASSRQYRKRIRAEEETTPLLEEHSFSTSNTDEKKVSRSGEHLVKSGLEDPRLNDDFESPGGDSAKEKRKATCLRWQVACAR